MSFFEVIFGEMLLIQLAAFDDITSIRAAHDMSIIACESTTLSFLLVATRCSILKISSKAAHCARKRAKLRRQCLRARALRLLGYWAPLPLRPATVGTTAVLLALVAADGLLS
jgi:hypothetical protein